MFRWNDMRTSRHSQPEPPLRARFPDPLLAVGRKES